jgi:intein/homing endonuclease
MGRTDESLKGSRSEREVLLQRFEGTVIESILVHNRSDKATDLTVERRYDNVKETREAFLDEYISKSGDLENIADMDEFKQQFRSGFEGSRGAGKTLSRFSQNICRNVIQFYTEEGDTIVDPFAGHNCLTQEAPVISKRGVIPIEDIVVGDFVLTHKNRFREVIGTQKNYGGDGGKQFTIAGNMVLPITDNHPMWVYQTELCPYYRNDKTLVSGKRCLKECSISKNKENLVRIKKGDVNYRGGDRRTSMCTKPFENYKADFKYAKDVKVGSYIGFPIDSDIIDTEFILISDKTWIGSNTKIQGDYIVTTKKVNNKILINEEFMRLVGYFIAEGTALGSLTFSFHKKEVEYRKDVMYLLDKCLGMDSSEEINDETNTGYVISENSEAITRFFRETFGTHSYSKKLPEFLMKLPKEKQKEFILGYFRGDGHFNTETSQRVAVTTSQTLALQLKILLLRLDLIPNTRKVPFEKQNSYKINDKWGIQSKHDAYYVYVSGSDINVIDKILGNKHDVIYKNKFNTFVKDGYAWYKVLKIKDHDLSQKYVYNIEVDEDNSYTLMQGCVHNSRMEATYRTNRNYYGQDLCHEFMEDNRKVRDMLLAQNSGKLFMKPKTTVIDLSEGDSRKLPWDDNFGDFTVTSPPYWCLVPETHILTKRGTIEIQDLKEGDFVYTHNGRWRKVKGVSFREIDDTITRIKVKNNSTPLNLTDNHKLLALKTSVCAYFKKDSVCRPNCGYLNNGNWEKHKCTKSCENYTPTFTLPTELTRQHYVAAPIDRTVNKSENIILRKTVAKNKYDFTLKNDIPVTKELARFIGYYIAEGSSVEGGVDLCFNKNEVEYIEDVKNLFETLFGISHVYYHEQVNAAHVGVYCTPLQEWLNVNCGEGSLNKKVPDFLLHEELEIQKELMLGLYSGDGCDYSEGYNYSTVSKTLKEQIKFILLRFNISPTMGHQKGGYRNILGRVCYTNTSYSLNVIDKNGICLLDNVLGRKHRKANIGTNCYSQSFIVNDYVYYRVSKVSKIHYKGKVYNCEVEEDNSYTTDVCTVHNCLEDYGPEKEQLGYGMNQTYEEFLDGMQLVCNENYRVLKPGAFCIYFINDFRKDGKFYDFHGDMKNLLVNSGFVYHDLIIADLGPSLRSVFLAAAFKSKVLPKRHEFGVVMRKPLLKGK